MENIQFIHIQKKDSFLIHSLVVQSVYLCKIQVRDIHGIRIHKEKSISWVECLSCSSNLSRETNTTDTHYRRLTQHNHLVKSLKYDKKLFEVPRLITKITSVTSSIYTSN